MFFIKTIAGSHGLMSQHGLEKLVLLALITVTVFLQFSVKKYIKINQATAAFSERRCCPAAVLSETKKMKHIGPVLTAAYCV